MNTYFKKIVLFVLLLPGTHSTLSENIVVDLGGVLIHTDSFKACKEVGVKRFASYIFTGKNPLKLSRLLRNRLYGFFETIFSDHTTHNSCDEHGTQLPTLIYYWLKGTLTTTQIQTIITTGAHQHNDYFNTSAERDIIIALAQMTFTPKRFIATRSLNKAGIQFIRSCKEAGHSVYILSNWDTDSFELLRQQFPELFSLCDGTVISGTSHSIKPESTIYQNLLDSYHLDPAQTIFLDDRSENLNTAQAYGIATIHCSIDKVSTFDAIYDELNAWLASH